MRRSLRTGSSREVKKFALNENAYRQRPLCLAGVLVRRISVLVDLEQFAHSAGAVNHAG